MYRNHTHHHDRPDPVARLVCILEALSQAHHPPLAADIGAQYAGIRTTATDPRLHAEPGTGALPPWAAPEVPRQTGAGWATGAMRQAS